MAVDKCVNISNNDSVIVNECPQNKLFPIFTNQTPSPKHVIR